MPPQPFLNSLIPISFSAPLFSFIMLQSYGPPRLVPFFFELKAFFIMRLYGFIQLFLLLPILLFSSGPIFFFILLHSFGPPLLGLFFFELKLDDSTLIF